MRTIAIAIALVSACTTAATIPASEACQEVEYRLCDATKECLGDVTTCLANMRKVCTGKTGNVDAAPLNACLDALEPHGCNGTMPTFSAKGSACLGMY